MTPQNRGRTGTYWDRAASGGEGNKIVITVKARLARADNAAAEDLRDFHVLELTTAEGDDLSALVRRDDVFKTVEELNAFLTLRLAREARRGLRLTSDHACAALGLEIRRRVPTRR